MFNKLFRRSAKTAARTAASEQLKLDVLRYNNADNQLMQLHCDRMQVALDAQLAA
jgi:hypothetical protein